MRRCINYMCDAPRSAVGATRPSLIHVLNNNRSLGGVHKARKWPSSLRTISRPRDVPTTQRAPSAAIQEATSSCSKTLRKSQNPTACSRTFWRERRLNDATSALTDMLTAFAAYLRPPPPPHIWLIPSISPLTPLIASHPSVDYCVTLSTMGHAVAVRPHASPTTGSPMTPIYTTTFSAVPYQTEKVITLTLYPIPCSIISIKSTIEENTIQLSSHV